MKAVELVNISELIPIYRDGIPAANIEVAKFKYETGESCGYTVIVQKGLYKIGSKAIYIQPDWCLSELDLFKSFTEPNGDPKKSRLGKKRRIRAIKFNNFKFSDSDETIYSCGILFPFDELGDDLKASNDLQKDLGIVKYEADIPNSMASGLTAGDLPAFLYATDEETYQNKIDTINRVIKEGEILTLSQKRDGSSSTIYFKKDSDAAFDRNLLPQDEARELLQMYGIIKYRVGVCSRNQEKKLEQTYTDHYITPEGYELHRWFNKETNEKGWWSPTIQKYYTNDEVKGFKSITKEIRDSWVDIAKNSNYILDGLLYCLHHDVEIALRGELIGKGLKGSGNKLNPDTSLEPTIILFGVDDLSSGHAKKINWSSEHNLENVATAIGKPWTKPVWEGKVNSLEELIGICNKWFGEQKEKGIIPEGIVIRTKFSNKLSCKYINPEYDANN